MTRLYALVVFCGILGCDSSSDLPVTNTTSQEIADSLGFAPTVSTFEVSNYSSRVNFTTFKDDMVPVTFMVHEPGGSVSMYDGDFSTAFGKVLVPLAGLDSSDTTRDTRVMDVFFEMSDTNQYVVFSFDGMSVVSAGDGEWDAVVDAAVTIAGVSQSVTADLHISEEDGGVRLKTNQPLELSIDQFELSENLQMLMELCHHSYVDDTVEVEVDLILRR